MNLNILLDKKIIFRYNKPLKISIIKIMNKMFNNISFVSQVLNTSGVLIITGTSTTTTNPPGG
jgi:hypothetical protein